MWGWERALSFTNGTLSVVMVATGEYGSALSPFLLLTSARASAHSYVDSLVPKVQFREYMYWDICIETHRPSPDDFPGAKSRPKDALCGESQLPPMEGWGGDLETHLLSWHNRHHCYDSMALPIS